MRDVGFGIVLDGGILLKHDRNFIELPQVI